VTYYLEEMSNCTDLKYQHQNSDSAGFLHILKIKKVYRFKH